LPDEVQAAVDWTVNVTHQQKDYWGWGWPINWDQGQEFPPRYWISEGDLAKFKDCLHFLEEIIERHPFDAKQEGKTASGPKPTNTGVGIGWMNDWREFAELAKAYKDADKAPNARRFIEVRRLQGGSSTLDLSKSRHWKGRTDYDVGYDAHFRVDMHRTPGGRWVLSTIYSGPGMLCFIDIPPDDEWIEVPIERAARWFTSEWAGSYGEGDEPLPPEIEEQLGSMDIDGPEKSPPLAVPTVEKTTMVDALIPKEDNDDRSEVRWKIIREYHGRLKRNESTSHRSIAKALSCSPGYVSEVLSSLTPDDRKAPRGWKDEDGSIEAIA
jgi:hypothetical protein